MPRKFLTIIIPVFNTNLTFLKKCINSVKKQNCNDVEIIIIDDYSKYRISSFLKKINDKKIRVYRNLRNYGVSFSRNKAVNISRGEYITFVDSDDYIFQKTLNSIKNSIIKNKFPDIVATKFDTNYFKIINNKKFFDKNFNFKKKEQIITNFSKISYKQFWHFDTVWGLFFRKKFLKKNRIFFEKKAFRGEDQEYVVKSFFLSNKTLIIKKKFYYYRIHNENLRYNNSISEINMLEGNIKLIKNLITFFNKRKLRNSVNNFHIDVIKNLLLGSIPFAYEVEKKILLKINKILQKNKYYFGKYKKINFLKIKKKFDIFFNILLKSVKKSKIFVYCAFESSLPIIKFLNKNNIPIKAIIDTNKNLKNKYFFNNKIWDLNKLFSYYKNEKNIIILVTHPERKTFLQIKKNIIKKGFKEKIIKEIGYKKIFFSA